MTLSVNAGRHRQARRGGTGSVVTGLRGLARLVGCAAGLAAASVAGAADVAAGLITAAGNASDEVERLAHLRALAAPGVTPLDATTRAELALLLPVVAAWAEGRARASDAVARGQGETHRYLHQFFDNQALAFTPVFPTAPRPASPLYPLWAFYRGRFLAWSFLEHSGVSAVPERRAAFLAEAARCFTLARAAFPANDLLKIYTGENVPAANLSGWDERAPAWANHQRRALEQLHAIIRWWIAERQLANGEFGGKWGDDVEMWRWWSPILIGFDDPVVTAAQARLARGNLARPGLAAGYTSQLTDVEHTSEETADTLTPMQHISGEDPDWAARTRRLLELADKVWWAENAQGRLQFRHIDFNHERLGPNPARAYDTAYHVRVVQPVLLLWQRTRDPRLGTPLSRWLRTWAEAALGSENQKPAGIVPAALQWPSGRPGSTERGWPGPALDGDPMERLYSWPGHPVMAMTAALLQAHTLTGDPVFLAPLLRMAGQRRAHLAAGNPDGPAGSPAWAAHRLPEIINEPLAKWRQWSGDTRFDDLLRAEASSYVRFVLTRETDALERSLAASAAALSSNWPMFTSEVRYTDRVLAFPSRWPRPGQPETARVDAALLYSTVTGDPGSVDTFPLNGARWHTVPRDFAVLVAENRRDRFAADAFHFGPGPRSLRVSLLTLDPGAYRWTLATLEGRPLESGELTLNAVDRTLPLTLPARTAVRLTLQSDR